MDRYNPRTAFEAMVLENLRRQELDLKYLKDISARVDERLDLLEAYASRIKPALDLYETMVPLNVTRLLPEILKDFEESDFLEKLHAGYWQKWGRILIVVSIGGTLIAAATSIVTLGISLYTHHP